MIFDLDRLVEVVQRNCDIADARHAADLTLCTYLLEMRELYRWERDLSFVEQLPHDEVGGWLTRREALWRSLEGKEFETLPLGASAVDPFCAATVNAELVPQGLLYSAGYGRMRRAQFHLGTLEREERRGDLRILVGGREYARDLGSAPAALLDTTVYVRGESFRRWLWERFETWSTRRPEGAMAAALAHYGFEDDALAALERMAEAETETLILHEQGEFAAARALGPDWETVVASTRGVAGERVLRAVRDNLADCLVTLPRLIERDARPSIHFWFATFEGLRSELFPRLSLAYKAWRDGDAYPLVDAIDAGREHWQRVCEQVLALDRDPETFERALAEISAAPATML